MGEYIQHLTEDGEWEFSKVKSVGDLSQLATKEKETVVGSINEVAKAMGLNTESMKAILESINTTNKHLGEFEVKLKDTNEELEDAITKGKADKAAIEKEVKESKQSIKNSLEDFDNKKNAIIKEIEAIQKNFDDKAVLIDGKLVAIEKEVKDFGDGLQSKVSRTELDESVGVNKWVYTSYNSDDDLETRYPKIDDITGRDDVTTDEIDDGVKLSMDSDIIGKGIAHLFTNVKVASAKTVEFNVEHQLGASVMVNGGYVYYKAGEGKGLVSISLRGGWNTVEVLYGVNRDNRHIMFDTVLNKQVNRMTTTIGVGDKNESRLKHSETLITQTSEQISLKADKSTVEDIGNTVNNHTSELKVQAELIESKVSGEKFENYSKRIEKAESDIKQTKESIESIVSKEIIDKLNSTVEKFTADMKIMSDKISSSVTKEEFDELDGKFSKALTEFEQTAESMKAGLSKVTEFGGNIEKIEAQIKLNTEAIEQSMKQTGIEELTGRITTAETLLKTTSEQISLKADKKVVDAELEKVNKIGAEFNVNAGKINSSVAAIKKSVDAQGKKVTTQGTEIKQLKDEISKKVSEQEVVKLFDDENKALKEEINTTQTEVKQMKDSIVNKVEQSTVDALKEDYGTRISKVEQTANGIQSTVSEKLTMKQMEDRLMAGGINPNLLNEDLGTVVVEQGLNRVSVEKLTTLLYNLDDELHRNGQDNLNIIISYDVKVSLDGKRIYGVSKIQDVLDLGMYIKWTLRLKPLYDQHLKTEQVDSLFGTTFKRRSVVFRSRRHILKDAYMPIMEVYMRGVETEDGKKCRVEFSNFKVEVSSGRQYTEYVENASVLNKITTTTLKQHSDSINAKVAKGDVISEINMDTSGVKIKAEKIGIEGKAIFTSAKKEITELINSEVAKEVDGKIASESGFGEAFNGFRDEFNEFGEELSQFEKDLAKAKLDIEDAQKELGVFDNWKSNRDSTEIDGAKITTGTIDANKLIASSITADKIQFRSITGMQIASNTITGENILTGSITADKIKGSLIDGKTIIGATIKTSAMAGDGEGGVIFDKSGIKGYGEEGVNFNLGTDGKLFVKNAEIEGTVKAGGDSVFSGQLTTEKDIVVGSSIYLQPSKNSERFNLRGLYIYSQGGIETSITGTYVKMDFNAPQSYNFNGKNTRLNVDGRLMAHNGLTALGDIRFGSDAAPTTVDFTNAKVKGVAATFS